MGDKILTIFLYEPQKRNCVCTRKYNLAEEVLNMTE